MSELLKICGVAIICSAAAVIVGKGAGGGAFAVRLGGAVLILGLVSALAVSAVEYLSALCALYIPSQYFSIMLKALGVCVLCRICSDICRDCGDATASSAVESAAKLTLVLMSIPILEELIGYAASLSERF